MPKRVSDDPRQVNFRRTKFFSSRFFGLGNRFAPFWTNFGGSTEKRTSTANSSQFFALDAPIMSSVQPKIVGNMSVGALGSEMYRSNPPCPQPHQCGQGRQGGLALSWDRGWVRTQKPKILAFDRGWGRGFGRNGGPQPRSNDEKIVFLPARTITKIFSKRFFCPHRPL